MSSTQRLTGATSRPEKRSGVTATPAGASRGRGRPSKREERAFAIYARLAAPGMTASSLRRLTEECERMARAFDTAFRQIPND